LQRYSTNRVQLPVASRERADAVKVCRRYPSAIFAAMLSHRKFPFVRMPASRRRNFQKPDSSKSSQAKVGQTLACPTFAWLDLVQKSFESGFGIHHSELFHERDAVQGRRQRSQIHRFFRVCSKLNIN